MGVLRQVIPFAALVLASCARSDTLEAGNFTIQLNPERGTFSIRHPDGLRLDDVQILSGTGSADITMQFGAFRFDNVTRNLALPSTLGDPAGSRQGPNHVLDLLDKSGAPLGLLALSPIGDTLEMQFTPTARTTRVGIRAKCQNNDHFLGLGGHAQDVDHMGEAFALWTSEPGIGKASDDEIPSGWPIEGTKHATSYPIPFLIRPQQPAGLLLDTPGRVDVDLCSSGGTFEMLAWDRALRVVAIAAAQPAGVLRGLSDITGRPDLPAPWVFGPWNDAIRGSERVREVAATLADAGAPTTAIWTEDWKGGEEDATGYHLTGEWFLDEDLYPDAAEIDAELESDGLAWLAYFSPFLFEGTETWDEADAAGVIVKTVEGEPYTFLGATLDPTGLLDLSTQPGRDFAIDRMHGAMNLGFEGWMADFAEWLPADAILNNGSVGLDVHNIYPQWWQVTNAEAVAGTDAAFFVRSGWTYTAGMVPVVWGGDQRTDFQTDDGLPSVVAMGLGLGASGVPTFTHDVAGYQSFLNEPSDKEVWFRWSWLGAFSPIHRTHHGAFDTANWAFDRDEETLAFHAQVTTEHMRLFPYRYGLAGRASRDGTPAVLPVAFVHGGDDWGRLDAWMLGDALLVAPVTEPGVAGREVELPTGTAWYGWFDHNPVSSGWVDSPMDTIPVFAASGTTVPTFTTVPQSVRDPAQFDAADAERTVTLFGDGGRFVEADGTTYTPRGVALGSGTVTARLKSGEVDVGGLTVAIAGPTERSYTLVVVK